MRPDYDRARRLATRLLLEQRLYSLRIDVRRLCYRQVIRFDTMAHFCSVTHMALEQLAVAGDCLRDGCTLVREKGGRTVYLVLYNGDKNRRRQSFTLAHEVGHVVLEHQTDDEIRETEANCFAAQLLAPRVLVNALAERVSRPLSAEDLCQVFALSHEAAEHRLRELARFSPASFFEEEQALLAKCVHLLPSPADPVVDYGG